jgi:hypothetical protein
VYRRRNVIARYFSSVPILRRIQGRPWVVRVKPNHPEWVHKCAHILVSVLPDPTHGDTLGNHPVPHPQPENSRGALPLLQYHHDVQLLPSPPPDQYTSAARLSACNPPRLNARLNAPRSPVLHPPQARSTQCREASQLQLHKCFKVPRTAHRPFKFLIRPISMLNFVDVFRGGRKCCT